MKKYIKTLKHKNYNKKRALYEAKKRVRFKEYQKKKNRELLGIPKVKKFPKPNNQNQFQFKKANIIAPRIFSFTRNPDELVAFIEKINFNLNKKRNVFIILRDVEEIDYDAIVVLLSIMFKFKEKNIDFNGDYPKNQKVRNILEESEFFKVLYARSFKETNDYKIGNRNTIFTRARKDANSQTGARIIEFSSKTIWGEKRRCPGVQRTLIELMQNTNNHAKIGKFGHVHWWLSVNQDYENNCVSFSFVDFGVGIFKSLEHKPRKSKFYGWKEKIIKTLSISSNADILRSICKGEFHATVTNQSFRGKGIPGIVETLERNQISDLYIITNDVYANVNDESYRLLEKNFSGTFVHWKLHQSNSSLKWELQ